MNTSKILNWSTFVILVILSFFVALSDNTIEVEGFTRLLVSSCIILYAGRFYRDNLK